MFPGSYTIESFMLVVSFQFPSPVGPNGVCVFTHTNRASSHVSQASRHLAACTGFVCVCVAFHQLITRSESDRRYQSHSSHLTHTHTYNIILSLQSTRPSSQLAAWYFSPHPFSAANVHRALASVQMGRHAPIISKGEHAQADTPNARVLLAGRMSVRWVTATVCMLRAFA